MTVCSIRVFKYFIQLFINMESLDVHGTSTSLSITIIFAGKICLLVIQEHVLMEVTS